MSKNKINKVEIEEGLFIVSTRGNLKSHDEMKEQASSIANWARQEAKKKKYNVFANFNSNR